MKLANITVTWPNGTQRVYTGKGLVLSRRETFAWVDLRDTSLPKHDSGHERLIAMIPAGCLIELNYEPEPAPQSDEEDR